MILYCIGCGKSIPDWTCHLGSPTCHDCVGKPEVRECVSALRQGAKPQSALVHIHEDCYVDAACVVSVEATNWKDCGQVEVKVVELFMVDLLHSANRLRSRWFRTEDYKTAQQLAREIMERVNAGRGMSRFERKFPPQIEGPKGRPSGRELFERIRVGEGFTYKAKPVIDCVGDESVPLPRINACTCLYTTHEAAMEANKNGTHHPGCPAAQLHIGKGVKYEVNESHVTPEVQAKIHSETDRVIREWAAKEKVYAALSASESVVVGPAIGVAVVAARCDCTCSTSDLMASGCGCGAINDK